ncbi:MAG: hypothetical protein ACK4K9_11520 [Bacteroidia bacterium]
MAIETTTIASLRAKTTNTADIYYVTDFNKEGNWYYDPTDLSSLDNEGTVLVSNSGMRFKRIYEKGFVNAPWFFKDTDPDATLGVQRALDFISNTIVDTIPSPHEFHPTGGGTVFLPKGVYFISGSLVIGQHCRFIGVSKSATEYNDNNSGSVIIVNPNTIESPEMWAIESATYNKDSNPKYKPLYYNSFIDDGIGRNYTFSFAIVIENLTIYCNEIYGGIKLINSPYSVIKNVSVFASNIGIYLNNCWNCTIQDTYVRRVNWYGIVLAETNVCELINCAVSGKSEDQTNPEKYLINESDLPNFVPTDYFIDFGLDDYTKRGRTGFYIGRNANSNVIINGSSEAFTIGISSISNSNLEVSTAYIEDIIYYGIVTGIGLAQTFLNTLYFERIGIPPYNSENLANSYPFYFGMGTSAEISTVNCRTIETNVGKLFKILTESAYITFSNTIYAKRVYNKNVLFFDETPNGANFCSVYIDPEFGNDENYGFNKNDAIQTFDAALIRVQNQSSLNPVKSIYIKAAPSIGEGIDPRDGASIKNLNIVPIENTEILIQTYGIDLNSNPPRIKGRIFFEGDLSPNKIAMIGQIELKGNVNLYFRDVDLYCNNPHAMSANPSNLTMFGLNNSYAKLTFNNNSIYSPPFDIDLNAPYFLVQANLDSPILVSPHSLIEIKFINISINGGALSPVQLGNQNLGVDCIQIASSRTGNGWQDAQIIQNNF